MGLIKPLSDDRPFLSYRQIRIIEAIAEHRGIGQAAEALHLSQPAVTRALQSVEDMLGVRLFDRTPNGVLPTIFAEPILKRARSIDAAIRETERDLKKMQMPELNRLRVGAGIHSIEIWANRTASMLALANHDVQISVTQYDWNDLIAHVLDGSLDISLGELSELEDRPDISVEPLAELPLHFVCRAHHPLVKIENPILEDISRFPMVGNKLAKPLAAHIQSRLGQLGVVDAEAGGIFSAIRVTNLNAIKQSLLASHAVAVMPLESIKQDLASGELIALGRHNMPWLIGRIGFITAKARKASALSLTFRKAVLEIEAERRAASSNSADQF